MASATTKARDELLAAANNAQASGEAKPTNPKDAVGSRKARWFSYMPVRVMVGIGLALLEGARKYGRHNYRIAGVRASVYLDACICGHLMPWAEGEDIDPDSGLSHIDKAIASLVVLRDSMYEGNWVDDRAPAAKGFVEMMADAHKKAGEIIDRYPDAKPAFIRADTLWFTKPVSEPEEIVVEWPVEQTLLPLSKKCRVFRNTGRHSLTTLGDPRPGKAKAGFMVNHCDCCGGMEPFTSLPRRKK